MRLIRFYVAKNVLGAMLIVLLGVISLDLVFRIVDGASFTTQRYTFTHVIIYELLRTPARIYKFMPMVGLIGCLAGLGALASNSELVVMRANGVSTFTLLQIALLPAVLLLIVAMFIGDRVAPKTEQMAQVYYTQAHGYKRDVLQRGTWVRDGKDFIQIGAIHSSGMLYNITIFSFQEMVLRSITQAQRANHVEGVWQLENVRRTNFNQLTSLEANTQVENFKQYDWHSDLNPELLDSVATDPEDLPLAQLWQHMQYLKAQALNSSSYELAFWGKVFYPLVMISLVITGASFIFGPLRQVSMGLRVFWGILVGISLKTLQDILAPISMVYGFEPMYAMLFPALLCGAVGLGILAKVR